MLIRTYADIEKLQGEDALSPAEKKLIEGCKRGELTTLGNGTRPKRASKARTIRADLLRYLILGGCEQCRVHEKGVQLSGAWIGGQLDLSFASANGAVLLLSCAFAKPLVAEQACFDRLFLNRSSLPGLNAEGATIKGHIFLDQAKSTGEASFGGAEIGGQLSCNGAELNCGEGKALNAQSATIRGGAFLRNLKSTGEVSFAGAEIGGQLSANEAALNGGDGIALNAQGATIRGGAYLDNLKSAGEVSFSGAEIGGQFSAEEAELNGGGNTILNLQGATVKDDVILDNLKSTGGVSLAGAEIGGQLSSNNAELNYGEGQALNAHSAKIRGGVYLDKSKTSGEVTFAGAVIDGQLSAEEAVLNGRKGKALNAEGSTIRDGVFLRKFEGVGEVSFAGAEIGGQLSANEAALNGGDGTALNAQRATIRGGAYLDNLKSEGEVSFSGAEIGGQFSAEEAELNGADGAALNAPSATIKRGVYLRNLKSTGEVSFLGAEIGGQFVVRGAELNGGKGMALNAQRMFVGGGFIWRKLKAVVGTVDLNAAEFRDLVDDEQSWNAVPSLMLVGATYENLIGPFNLPFRKRWLKKGASPESQFHPQPYQQLAKFYRETGHSREAREILIEKEREQRKAAKSGILVRLWDAAAEAVAGYGYKPWLSLWWLGGLVAIMMGMAQLAWNAGDFAPNSAVVLTSPDWKAIADGPSQNPADDWTKPHAPGKDYETFYAFAYALDVVVPVLDLGQTDAWAPSPARGEWGHRLFYAQKMFIVLGWVVTAIAAAAISGMIRRDD